MFNRQSVQSALRSLIAKLSTWKTLPPNGLALFCGCIGKEGKEKKLFTIEPLKPLVSGLYRCDSKFYLEPLYEQLEANRTFGFIIIDGNGVSIHTLSGNNRRTLFKKDITLPNKHDNGGQSKNRFEHIRIEKRGWYTTEVAENVCAKFINPTTCLPNVDGIVIAGCAHLKDDVYSKLDPRLLSIVVAVVDVQYGGVSGFNQAISLTRELLGNLKFTHEQNVISKLFEEIHRDGLYAIGIEDTMYALTNGLLDSLIIWNDLSYVRWELVKKATNETKILYLSEEKDLDESAEWTVHSKVALLDWVLEHYNEFGAVIELVSDETDVGAQFVKGFGGLGGILRFRTELPSNNPQLVQNEDENEEDEYEYAW